MKMYRHRQQKTTPSLVVNCVFSSSKPTLGLAGAGEATSSEAAPSIQEGTAAFDLAVAGLRFVPRLLLVVGLFFLLPERKEEDTVVVVVVLVSSSPSGQTGSSFCADCFGALDFGAPFFPLEAAAFFFSGGSSPKAPAKEVGPNAAGEFEEAGSTESLPIRCAILAINDSSSSSMISTSSSSLDFDGPCRLLWSGGKGGGGAALVAVAFVICAAPAFASELAVGLDLVVPLGAAALVVREAAGRAEEADVVRELSAFLGRAAGIDAPPSSSSSLNSSPKSLSSSSSDQAFAFFFPLPLVFTAAYAEKDSGASMHGAGAV